MAVWWYVVEINFILSLWIGLSNCSVLMRRGFSWEVAGVTAVYLAYAVVAGRLAAKGTLLGRILVFALLMCNAAALLPVALSDQEAVIARVYYLLFTLYLLAGSIRLITLRRRDIRPLGSDFF